MSNHENILFHYTYFKALHIACRQNEAKTTSESHVIFQFFCDLTEYFLEIQPLKDFANSQVQHKYSDLTSSDFGQIVLTYTDSKSTVLRSSQRALRRGTTQYTLHSCCQHSQKKPLLLKIIKLSYFFSKLSHELMMHRLHNCSVL